MKKTALILASHSYRDPLFQGLMLPYLLALKQEAGMENQVFYFITEEQSDYALEPQAQAEEQKRLAALGLHWLPLPYEGGRFILFKKLRHFLRLWALVGKLRKQAHIDCLIGYMGIAGGYAFMLSRLRNLPLGIMGFEPHSLNMRDFGIWSPNSLRFRILSTVERWQVRGAQALVAPTVHTAALFKDWGSQAKVWTLGTSVDTEAFQPSAAARLRLRPSWGWGESEKILLYVGKFGGIYYEAADLGRFFQELQGFFPQFRLLVITPEQAERVAEDLAASGLDSASFRVLGRIPYAEISDYFAACDWGLIAVPPLPSQRYRSPVKTGHYLSCGLPYLIPKGVSDDDDLAENQGVGIALEGLQFGELAAEKMRQYLSQSGAELSAHCRKVGVSERGLHRSVAALQGMLKVLRKES